jgi:L-lactate dehydrogenase (cytochrome)
VSTEDISEVNRVAAGNLPPGPDGDHIAAGQSSSALSIRTRRDRFRKFEAFLALDDFEVRASRILPRMIFGYISGMAERGQSLADNRASFLDYAFRPRVLVDSSQRSQATSLLGHTWAVPFGIAPMGGAGLAARDGDLVLARAAAEANIPFIFSAASITPLERVAAIGGSPWFQAYLPGDPGRILPLLDRVAAAGFETLVVTVDVPVIGNRENNLRVGFSMPLKPSPSLALQMASRPRWLAQWIFSLLRSGMPHLENMEAARGPPILSRSLERNFNLRDKLSWEHIDLIRNRWRGRLVLKGILRGDDAGLARDRGVDGVIVSNHGGRQLDGAIAPLKVLAEVVAEAGRMDVMLDGGVRRGSDVVKAVALGARGVFVGRPFLYAAVVGGEPAVGHAIDLLTTEIDRNMAMLGLCRLADVGPDLIARSA